MNVTYLVLLTVTGKRGLCCNPSEMTARWIGVAVNPGTASLEETSLGTETHREEGREDGGRRWSDTGTSQEHEDGRQHQKLAEAGRTLPESHQREPRPADTLVVDLQLPEQRNEHQ